MSKRSYSAELKCEILKALDENYSAYELGSKYNVCPSTILGWKRKYDKYGKESLKASTTWKKYAKAFKLAAIRDCLSGKYSIREVARLYEISDA
ncbi:Helix-turn-helix domain-containing protein, partial [Amphibacillus marinus]